MASEPQGNSSRTTRVIDATPEDLYSAFLDEAALVGWLPPAGMSGRMHVFDPRVGGGYEMSLFYPAEERRFRGKTADLEDRVRVRFVTLEAPRRIVEAVTFVSDDPAYGGEVTLTVTIEPVERGTAVTLAFEDLPAGIRPEDNDTGARASLEQLARRFERSA
jgi:uncharacterized protein YndB with AHSA1/START domain